METASDKNPGRTISSALRAPGHALPPESPLRSGSAFLPPFPVSSPSATGEKMSPLYKRLHADFIALEENIALPLPLEMNTKFFGRVVSRNCAGAAVSIRKPSKTPRVPPCSGRALRADSSGEGSQAIPVHYRLLWRRTRPVPRKAFSPSLIEISEMRLQRNRCSMTSACSASPTGK